MGFMGRKSQLKSKIISKVWLNRKDYKFLDFDFKVTNYTKEWYGSAFAVEVYNCNVLILKLGVKEYDNKYVNPNVNKHDLAVHDRRFSFITLYFNPQTDNDCFSINHIIAVTSNYIKKMNNIMIEVMRKL